MVPRPLAPTALQVWTASLFDLFGDARDQLDEREWQAFVSIACDRIGILPAELFLAEVLERGGEQQERDAV